MEESDIKDSSSDDYQLKIAETPKQKRKRKVKIPKEFKKLDKTIEATISKCKNLTSEVAKKMLCKLVKNDHVLALTLLKAEEEEEKSSNSESEELGKLTRLKAKQLNKQLPLPPLSLKTPQPDEDVIKLIQEDFAEDEENDEEYKPENESDDGEITNTTFSDIDSQPSTPGSALIGNDESPLKNSEFKVPKAPLTAEEQENIARRTRSKLCLQTTSIETIESTFVPPDIDLDMYDFEMYENEDDNEWKEFLNEFMMPLPKNTEEVDDDTDPTYAEPDFMPDDKEEQKLGRVSKKELNQLISELIEDSCNMPFDSFDATILKKNIDPPSTSKSSKKQSKFTPLKKQQYSSKNCPSIDLNTPPHPQEPSESNKSKISCTPDQAVNKNQHYYSPSNVQTPQRTGYLMQPSYQSPNTSLISTVPYHVAYAQNFPIQSTPLAHSSHSPLVHSQSQATFAPDYSPVKNLPSILVCNPNNSLEVRSLTDASGVFNTNNIMNQGFYYNGLYTLPQYQSVVVQIPTIDLLQNGFNFSTSLSSSLDQSSKNETKENISSENYTKDNTKKRESRLKIFDYLNNEEPAVKKNANVNKKGFIDDQYVIFEQQFRMHAQLLTQNYVQAYAHPTWWKSAKPLKENLQELKAVGPKNMTCHIENCIQLCEFWENELEENNDKNKKYMEFMYDEIELDNLAYQEKKHFRGRFHNRLMETVMRSKAIIYPSLLPKTPFRSVRFTKVDPIPSELTMIALGIENCYEKVYKELNCLNPRRLREPKITSIVCEIIRIFGSFRSENGLLKIIEKYKQHHIMNPIKYYFKHKKAPSIKHSIEAVDFENLQAPVNMMRGMLPKVWDEYKFSEERLQVFPFDDGSKRTDDSKLIAVQNSEDKQEKSKKEEIENLSSQQKVIIEDKTLKLEIVYDLKPSISITILPYEKGEEQSETKKIEANGNIQKRNPSLKNWQKTNEEKQRNLTSILKKVTSNIEKSPSKKKSVNFLLPKEKSIKYLPTNFIKNYKIKASSNPRKKFQLIIEKFFSEFSKALPSALKDEIHPLIHKLFIRTRSFDIYWQIVSCNMMLSKKNKQNGSSTNGTSDGISKTKKQISSEEYSKKINRKLADNRALIMQSAQNPNTVEKDCSYSYNFLQRVKKTLLENSEDELYSQFMKMLTNFNPEIESVPELYYNMENILLPNYPDLLDLFLTFLLPEHASEIGRFCEHFMLTNMTNLVEKLNFFFQKQPHLKKIYACINDLSNESDLTLERLKSKILPLLKGNQVLIDWFLELFDRPITESSVDEYETLYLKKETADDGYEEMQSQDLLECSNNNFLSCGVKYINGKIMYRCKTLLPAKISFLANDNSVYCDEKNGQEQEASLCIHEIRKHIQFNDNNIGKRPIENNNKEETKKKKLGKNKIKVCDSLTLHAHAVRLNTIHAQNGEKLADAMNLLESNCSKNTNGESPKKLFCKNSKKSGNSPKKVLKSPENSSSDVLICTQSSKPIQINCKLNVLINDGKNEQSTKRQKLMDIPDDRDLALQTTENDAVMEENQPLSEAPAASKSPEENYDNLQDPQILAWTREEDKLILEEIKIGYSEKEVLIANVCGKLENRCKNEISERVEFLLNFVTNLTGS